VSCFNLYRPPEIKLGDSDAVGPWLEHLEKIYPEDCVHIALWLAHRVQRPEEKINHALVLGGAQGIGKDTILEPVKHAVGPWNFKEASPTQVMGRFKGFLKAVILRVNEARDLGEFDRYTFYDHMKPYTAAPPDVLRVDEKNLREHSVLNCCGVIITTNHKTDGIYLPTDDRRHYVAWSDHVKEDFSIEYWNKIFALREEAVITQSKIAFPAFNATIQAIASDAGSAAGSNAVVAGFDELWAYTSERSRRLWDEMTPPPTRQIAFRLTVTYAGYEGESTLLEELYRRGLQQPQLGEDLYGGDGLLMFWSHKPVAPWQDEDWLISMRRERASAYARQVLNEFASSSSQFVDLNKWDRCVDQSLGHLSADLFLPVFVGVDASYKHDSTAIAAVAFDTGRQVVRLVTHRVFQPTSTEPLDFELTIEAYLLDLNRRFQVKEILYDPWQMQSVAQRLLKQNLPIEEFPQSSPNLTAASQNLFDLIESQGLVLYPDEAMRLSISRAIAIETPRGWRIGKDKGSHKIDVVVALAQACYAAVRAQRAPFFDTSYRWVDGTPIGGQPEEAARKQQEREDADEFHHARLVSYLAANGAFGFGPPWGVI
jgi:hypothetical protein